VCSSDLECFISQIVSRICSAISRAFSFIVSSFSEDRSSKENEYSIDLRRKTTDWIFDGAYNRPQNEMQILDILTKNYPNFTLGRSLGRGSFSNAFLFSFSNEEDSRQRVLKFTRFSKAREKPEYFSLSKDRIGGEWLALLSYGDKVATTKQALAFDNHTQQFCFVDAVTVQDLFEHPEKRESVDLTFIGSVSEYIEKSEDLKSRITKDPQSFTTEKIRSIAQQLLEGAAAIHQKSTPDGKGLIHRDIKPANILIDENDEIKFIDFGCACITDQNTQDNYRGSGLYAAPELQNGSSYDHKVDSYAIGMTLFQMATGGKHLKDSQSSLEDIADLQLKHLIEHLTLDKPEERLSVEQALQDSFFK